jgi:hypothetical protein
VINNDRQFFPNVPQTATAAGKGPNKVFVFFFVPVVCFDTKV